MRVEVGVYILDKLVQTHNFYASPYFLLPSSKTHIYTPNVELRHNIKFKQKNMFHKFIAADNKTRQKVLQEPVKRIVSANVAIKVRICVFPPTFSLRLVTIQEKSLVEIGKLMTRRLES